MKYPLIRSSFASEDLVAVRSLFDQPDPQLTNGPRVIEFEEAWSKWLGVNYSVFVNSGSSANLLSMTALKQKFPQGGEVIVPPLTWVSDIASVIQCGFKPVFVDVDLDTLGMNTDKILAAITEQTRAVFLSHIQGFNALTDKLLIELETLDISLIEDVCESHGVTHHGKKAGCFGWMSNFSFYYAHHMTTIEGGMVSTNDKDTYHNLRMLRSHGMVREIGDTNREKEWADAHLDLHPKFIFSYPSYNMRNTEIGAVLGLSQLKRLDQNNIRRTENLLHFLTHLDGLKFQTDFKIDGSSNYAFNLILKHPDYDLAERVMKAMDANEIEYRRGSAGGGNQLRQPYLSGYVENLNHSDQFPITEHVHFFGFYIGNFPDLKIEDVGFICNVLNAA